MCGNVRRNIEHFDSDPSRYCEEGEEGREGPLDIRKEQRKEKGLAVRYV